MPRLTGAHQLINAGTAITLARELGVSDAAIAQGLETAKWPARLQRLSEGPLLAQLAEKNPQGQLWLDGGHNEAAARALAAWLADLDTGPVHMIIGLLNTKAHHAYLNALSETGAQIHCVPIPDNDNCIAPDTLAASAKALGLEAAGFADIEKALTAISAPNALILIAGSLYLAGHVLRDNS